MLSPSTRTVLKRHSVPAVVGLLVVGAVLVVPPVVLGAVTWRTYALTAAILTLALGAAAPYALLVGVGTLPLVAVGAASFTAPPATADPQSFSVAAAGRHVIAGIAYVLAAAAVGGIWIAARLAVGSGSTMVSAVVRSLGLHAGGVLVGGAFVILQLWRSDTPLRRGKRRTILGTVVLGGLLALAPAVALWVFETTT